METTLILAFVIFVLSCWLIVKGKNVQEKFRSLGWCSNCVNPFEAALGKR